MRLVLAWIALVATMFGSLHSLPDSHGGLDLHADQFGAVAANAQDLMDLDASDAPLSAAGAFSHHHVTMFHAATALALGTGPTPKRTALLPGNSQPMRSRATSPPLQPPLT